MGSGFRRDDDAGRPMTEVAPPYPLWRRLQRRRRAIAWRFEWRWLATAILIGAVVVAGYLTSLPKLHDPRRALPEALAALEAHRWSVARDAALRAVVAGPRSGTAQLVLARAQIELGEGIAGEAALARAEAAGVSPARLHGLRGAAQLLQGDGDGALVQVAQASGMPARDGLAGGQAMAWRVQARALAAQGQGGRGQAVLTTWLTRHPRDAAAWSELGRIRLGAGDIGGAAEAAAQAVAIDRRDPAALVLEGEVVRTRVGPVAALPWFAAAVARDPGYHPALIEQAATLGDRGRYRAMLAAARAALVARPGSPQALYLEAVLAARSGRPALARELLARAGDALDALPGAQLLSGAVALAEGNAELAVSSLRDLVGAQPENWAARRLFGVALLRSGDAAGALAALRPIAVRADADAYTLELAARAMAATGDRAGAAVLHDRAGSGQAGPAPPFATEVGLGTLQAAVAAAPNDPTAVLALIRGLLASGDRVGALMAARELAAASPGAPAAWRAVGDVLLVGGDAKGAAVAFARSANLRFDAPAMLRLVDAYGRTGQARAAAGVIAAYLSQNPDDPVALRLAGHWQVAARQWSAAIRSLERVQARDGSREAGVLADLALAYAGAGRIGAARAAAGAAYALAPGQPVAVRAYAVVLGIAGDREGARQMRDKLARLAG